MRLDPRPGDKTYSETEPEANPRNCAGSGVTLGIPKGLARGRCLRRELGHRPSIRGHSTYRRGAEGATPPREDRDAPHPGYG